MLRIRIGPHGYACVQKQIGIEIGRYLGLFMSVITINNLLDIVHHVILHEAQDIT